MVSSNLSPRQKMINMLYVILIAMLAINISEEVLGGFEITRDDFDRNIEVQKTLNETLMDKLKGTDKEVAATKMKEDAIFAAKEFDQIKNSILEANSSEIFSTVSGNEGDLTSVKEVMMEGISPKAPVVKSHIENMRNLCLAMADDEIVRNVINSLLSTEDYADETWEHKHFHKLPVIGAEMMLKKAEYEIWTAMNLALANASGVLNAEEVAEAAEEVKKAEEEGKANENEAIENLIAEKAKEMSQSVKVAENENGEETLVMTELQAPLFAGYENVIKVATFSKGNSANNLKVTADNGSVEKSDKGYIVVPEGNAEKLNLKVMSGNKTLAEYEYNVLPLPMPKPVLVYTAQNGQQREYATEIPLTKKELLSISEVKLKFAGGVDTKESITGFDVMLIKKNSNEIIMKHADGNTVGSELKKMLGTVERGDKLVFMNIVAKGKYTGERKLVSVNVANM